PAINDFSNLIPHFNPVVGRPAYIRCFVPAVVFIRPYFIMPKIVGAYISVADTQRVSCRRVPVAGSVARAIQNLPPRRGVPSHGIGSFRPCAWRRIRSIDCRINGLCILRRIDVLETMQIPQYISTRISSVNAKSRSEEHTSELQ